MTHSTFQHVSPGGSLNNIIPFPQKLPIYQHCDGVLGGVELMSQAQISADQASSSTKQMMVIKEKLKLDRSATNAQAANQRQIVGSSTY